MAKSTLNRITDRAKQLYKKGKAGITWTAAIQKASKQLKGKSVGAYKVIERGEKKNTPAKRVIRQERTKKGEFKGYATVSGAMKAAKDLLYEQLTKKVAKLLITKKAVEKRKLRKEISAIRKQYNKL